MKELEESAAEQSENTFVQLMERLLKDERTEDLLKATRNKAFRETLYKEYNIDEH